MTAWAAQAAPGAFPRLSHRLSVALAAWLTGWVLAGFAVAATAKPVPVGHVRPAAVASTGHGRHSAIGAKRKQRRRHALHGQMRHGRHSAARATRKLHRRPATVRAMARYHAGRPQPAFPAAVPAAAPGNGLPAAGTIRITPSNADERGDVDTMPAKQPAGIGQGWVRSPGRLDQVMSLARLEIERGAPLAGLTTLTQADAGGTGNVDFLALKGAACQQLGRSADAAEYYRQALALAPDDGRWWAGLGLALETAGRKNGAHAAYHAALRDPELPAALRGFIVGRLPRTP